MSQVYIVDPHGFGLATSNTLRCFTDRSDCVNYLKKSVINTTSGHSYAIVYVFEDGVAGSRNYTPKVFADIVRQQINSEMTAALS